jgi:hypothetical protein
LSPFNLRLNDLRLDMSVNSLVDRSAY